MPRLGLLTALLISLGACAGLLDNTGPGRTAAAPVPPLEALPLDEAVMALAEATLAGARTVAPSPSGRYPLVIDPLIDRATGQETNATRSMVSRIEAVVRERHPEFELLPFTPASLDAKPLILLGAITSVEGPGSRTNTMRDIGAYRIWAILGDLRTGTILTRPMAWVRTDTVDATPAAFFRDSPAWVGTEPMRAAYLRTCSGNPGTQMDPAYLRGLRAQAVAAEGTAAFERGQAERARTLFAEAATVPGGEQARVLNGLYLSNWALGRRVEAEAAFGRLVDYGLASDRLVVKLLFRPGGTEFVRDPQVSAAYPMWLRQIAEGAVRQRACMRVVGHASVTGTAAANDRLSLARARKVSRQLVAEEPPLKPRLESEGRGAKEPIIGLGTDDMRDALDRRVEFAPRSCPGVTAEMPAPRS